MTLSIINLGLACCACLPLLRPKLSNISGLVLDAHSGEVLARVQVTLAGTPNTARTDGAGTFSFNAVPPGQYTLQVSTVGYRMVRRSFGTRPANPSSGI